MAIYLVKDCKNDSVDTVVEWSEADQEKAKQILLEYGFVREQGSMYKKGEDAISVGPKKITIPSNLKGTTVCTRMVADLCPTFYMDDRADLHYASDLFKPE